MIDRHFLDSFLKLNNTSGDMSEGEVRSILLKAGWSRDEVDSAVALLHHTDDNPDEPAPTLGQTFRPDMDFSGSELSKLLGVDVQLDPAVLAAQGQPAASLQDIVYKSMVGLLVIVCALLIVVGVVAGAVYYLGVDISPLVSLF